MATEKDEKILKRIRKIYENYGLDTSEMDEDEIGRLVEFYRENIDLLKKDFKKSVDYEASHPEKEAE